MLKKVTKQLIISVGGIVILLYILMYISVLDDGPDIGHTYPVRIRQDTPDEMACKIPILNPFNEDFTGVASDSARSRCEKYPMKFKTDYKGHLIRVEGNEEYFSRVNCCYFNFTRGQDDMQIAANEKLCFPITKNKTKIPPEHGFIAVKCGSENSKDQYYDYFGFVHLKPEVEMRATSHEVKPDQLSVVLVGFDSVSLVNYQRYMTKTRQYLRKNMSVIEFHGRNKVHESTFANVGPTLTGWTNDELTAVVKCWLNPPQDYFDDCPFIWKEYQEKGYRTIYGEDAISFSIYLDSTLNGFGKPIADYDFRTLLRGMELMDRDYGGCFTHQSSPEVLLNSVAKAAVTFRNKPYFHFTWITAFTHNSAEGANYVDQPMFELLQMLNDQNLLNKTAFFLLSDHGMTFGHYVQTEQGMLESRMPMLNVVLPEWFRLKYSKAVANLKTNRKRLSTPFDLHEMLTDLLDPSETISNSALKRRETEYYSKYRGISLFLPIPLNRTCADAGIDDHWCVCWTKTTIPNPGLDVAVKQAVQFSIDSLNSKLKPFPMCSVLKVSKILSARELHAVSTQITQVTHGESRVEVVFQVSPSSGVFQGTVILQQYANPRSGGPISRINAYKKQGDCIDSTQHGTLEIKSICFCSK